MNALVNARVSASYWADFTDEELIGEYRFFGVRQCFEELINRYRPSLERFLRSRYNLTGDELEDVAQASFVRAWRKLDQFDLSRRFSSWFYRIAATQAIDSYRRLTRGRCASLSDSRMNDETDSQDYDISGRESDPCLSLELNDTRKKVRAALAKLPQHFQQALELVFFQGLTFQRVAVILGVTVSSVSRRVARALNQLRYYLFDERPECVGERSLMIF